MLAVRALSQRAFHRAGFLSAAPTRVFGSASVKGACLNRNKSASRASKLTNAILAGSWHDPVWVMCNKALIESEKRKLERSSVNADEMRALQRAFTCMMRAADVRDHVNELLEQCSRHSGIMGVGLAAHEHVDNLEEHGRSVEEAYHVLLDQFPDFSAKLREAIGGGLALLRQKERFDFKEQHYRFF